jgi:hypothetical protein
MNVRKYIGLAGMITLVYFSACRQSEYDSMVKEELARNVRYDSIFFDLHFGTTRQDFYATCWKLNKQGLIKQGPGNLSVEYELDSGDLDHEGYMWFYPEFTEDTQKIYLMPVEFVYKGWAPWNKHLSADSLLPQVRTLLEKWYGGKFTYMENDNGDIRLWVKVDGNRRIRLYKKNEYTVKAEFLDLLASDSTRAKGK